MRVVIMGAGRTGSLLAVELDRDGHGVTLVDWNPVAFDRLPESFGGAIVLGNGLDQDVLRRAGVEEADAFVAATSGDNRNIMAGQIAQIAFHVPRVITRIKDPIRSEIFRQLGLEVDCRTMRGTESIMDLIAGD